MSAQKICEASYNESGNYCNHTHVCVLSFNHVFYDELTESGGPVVHMCSCGKEWND